MSPYCALAIGRRTLLGMTCRRCGVFKSGNQFERYRRSKRDKTHYVDRRCKECRWRHLDRQGGDTRV